MKQIFAHDFNKEGAMCVRPENIGTRLPKELLKRLDAEADRLMTSRSTVIRLALAKHLDYRREDEATA